MTLDSLYFEAQGCVPVWLENLHGILALELGPWVALGFSVGTEAFVEFLLINVPSSQDCSCVLRIWT